MMSLLMELSREKESLLAVVIELKLVIESLLLRVDNLEDATRGSVSGVEIPSMEVYIIVDEMPAVRGGKNI